MKSSVMLFCSIFLFGCHSGQDTTTSNANDLMDLTFDGAAWMRPAPNSFHAGDAELSKYSIEFHEVVAHEALAVVYSLGKDPFKEIDPVLAKMYTGVDYKVEPGKKLYLIRAVFHPSGTGDYHVIKDGDELLVTYDCLGHSINPQRSALVVALDSKPSNLFLEIHQAE